MRHIFLQTIYSEVRKAMEFVPTCIVILYRQMMSNYIFFLGRSHYSWAVDMKMKRALVVLEDWINLVVVSL